MDAHGWNLAEMCQRYHHGAGVAPPAAPAPAPAAPAASSPARADQAQTPAGIVQQQQQHIDQPSPSYSHYT